VQIFAASTAHHPPTLLQTVPFDRYVWDVFIIGNTGLLASMEWLFPRAARVETGGMIELLVTSEDNAYIYSLSVETLTMRMYHQSFECQEWPLRMTWISGQHGVNSDESLVLVSSRPYKPTVSAGQGSLDE